MEPNTSAGWIRNLSPKSTAVFATISILFERQSTDG
jgi:hypothetical protein